MASVTTTGTSSRQLAALRLLRRRLIQAVPLILGVVVINFCLIQLAPGSFLDLMTAENQVSDPATVELLRKTYGLDAPVWLQLVKYIWALLHLDFGFSYRQNMPVIDAIWISLPATLLLMISSIALALAVGVAAGVVASMKVRTFWDTVVSVLAMFFFAAPSFWLGIMLIVLFSVKLGWLPVGGMATIGGGGREVAVLGEQFGDELPGWSIVFDNQDGPWLSDSLALVHASLHCRQQRGLIHGLNNIFIRAKRGSHGGLVDNGNQNYWNPRGTRIGFEGRKEIPAIDGFHDDVHGDRARL